MSSFIYDYQLIPSYNLILFGGRGFIGAFVTLKLISVIWYFRGKTEEMKQSLMMFIGLKNKPLN